MFYVCERSVGPARTCDFRSGKVILQQAIEPSQMSKLLAEGRTDLMAGFISNRTRRPFKAYLVRKPDGKVGFEFQKGPAPRAGAAATDGATESAAPADSGQSIRGSETIDAVDAKGRGVGKTRPAKTSVAKAATTRKPATRKT
jgi:DNA topoisomerase-3